MDIVADLHREVAVREPAAVQLEMTAKHRSGMLAGGARSHHLSRLRQQRLGTDKTSPPLESRRRPAPYFSATTDTQRTFSASSSLNASPRYQRVLGRSSSWARQLPLLSLLITTTWSGRAGPPLTPRRRSVAPTLAVRCRTGAWDWARLTLPRNVLICSLRERLGAWRGTRLQLRGTSLRHHDRHPFQRLKCRR
jgi:hypothetical protein